MRQRNEDFVRPGLREPGASGDAARRGQNVQIASREGESDVLNLARRAVVAENRDVAPGKGGKRRRRDAALEGFPEWKNEDGEPRAAGKAYRMRRSSGCAHLPRSSCAKFQQESNKRLAEALVFLREGVSLQKSRSRKAWPTRGRFRIGDMSRAGPKLRDAPDPTSLKPMPNVFEKDGYRYLYSNDHQPIHVHVRKGDGEAVFNVGDEVDLRESQGLKIKELSKAQLLAEQHGLIIEKWHEHLDR